MAALFKVLFLVGSVLAWLPEPDFRAISDDWLVAAATTNNTCYAGLQTELPNTNYNSTVYCTGMCGSATAKIGVKGYNTTSFFCFDPTICASLNLVNNCTQVPTDKDISICCCDPNTAGNNCNIVGFGTITAPDPIRSTEPPIACYTGIWTNGNETYPGIYQACQGDCVSIQLDTANNSAILYTCDAGDTTYCRTYDILNKCSPIEPGMTGCCCDSDACLDPYKGRTPIEPLKCFSGINVATDNYTVGDSMPCDGMCVTVETKVNSKTVQIFQCTSKDVCTNGLQINGNGCNSFPVGVGNNLVTACCCDDSLNCNSKNYNLNYEIPFVNKSVTPLACWNGFYINGNTNGTAGWANCYGDCTSFQWNLGSSDTMTLYTCDPVSFIKQLQVDNACGSVGNLTGLKVCSCDKSGCLDGTSNIPIFAPTGLVCYVGVETNYTGARNGTTMYCDGKCGSATAVLGAYNTTAFFCMDQTVCNALGLANSCGEFPGDKEITGCCCDSGNSCNIANAGFTGLITPPPVKNATDPPIACYNGVWVNGKPLSSGVYQSCYGDCVSIQIDTTMDKANHTAVLYACDPSTLCRNLNILNKCNPIEPSMTGCCCDTDACIDPNRNRSPGNDLICFSGINVPENNFTVGDDIKCAGKCISIKSKVNGKSVAVYQCVQTSICKDGLSIPDNGCTSFKNGQDDVLACCCDTSNNCNVAGDTFNYTIPNVDWNVVPLACWSGLYQNNVPTGGTPGWSNCYGDCASIQWKTNTSSTMTLYGCDPVQFISQISLNNSCGTVDGLTGLKICSCDKSGCLDGTSNIPNLPTISTDLTCYVGIQSAFPNITSYGSTVYCNGKCGSASSVLNGYNTTVFFCLDQTICSSLGLANSCDGFPGDKEITGCCCDDSPNCAIGYANLTIKDQPPVKNATDPPIVCYAGIWINNMQTSSGIYQLCYGDCVSIQIDTTMNNVSHTAVLYSCDPSSFCTAYGILGKCSPIETGMTGCCCNSDTCIDPSRNRTLEGPTTRAASTGDLWTFISMLLLLSLYRNV